MKIERILFKVSGDLIENQEVLNKIKETAKDYSKCIDLIFGCGTQASEALNRAGIPFEYKNSIRETTPEGLEIILDVSNEIKLTLIKEFKCYNVHLIPTTRRINGIIENFNGDDIALMKYKNYDKTIVYTLKGRNKDKFKGLENVEIRCM